MNGIDPEFAALPLHELADAALSEARKSGAQHVDFRVERIHGQRLRLSDARLQSLVDTEDAGLAVRVIVDGTWGFAGTVDLTPAAARAAARQAVEVARVTAAMNTERIELAPEPAHGDVVWVSAYDVDPFAVPARDKVELLEGWSADLLAHSVVSHVNADLYQVKECKFYSDGATTATQQRVRLFPQLTAGAVTAAGFDDLCTLAPPAGRGLEYLTGTGWDFPGELAELPELLAEKVRAPSVQAGRYDLVIDPTNLWLTVHESIGHATELDRALGYEAAYAGTSFATPDKLGSLRYGSELMQVTADRTVEHGLSTVGWDDEGVAGQSWDLIVDGVFVGYQLDRRMAQLSGFGRSNGCAFAASPGHMPLERMPNVSLRPAPDGPDIAGLIAGVEDGVYVVGDKSWSIDMQRHNFQFTGQRFYRIRNGRLAGQLRDVAYQATTTDFWNSMQAVGGPQTYLLAGEFNCGKGQPGQVAPVSHGAPAACFAGVQVLNTAQEGTG
ncbi:TldD/PmbA family protein [Streptomyces sp. NBC_01102]|uniref:TldD/PmbA family protein n=1 Tax=Streptomyces sp. NBC_01102 TaxID=2903749 RepID=UPI003869E7C2|nr:TldD/PmbA family protein [Streptomyces sp. NBC_01102]